MRNIVFWSGWVILFLLPIAFFGEIYMIQDLPAVQPWKWAILIFAIGLIYMGRNRDDVLKHNLV
jgi:hypothetical protein